MIDVRPILFIVPNPHFYKLHPKVLKTFILPTDLISKAGQRIGGVV